MNARRARRGCSGAGPGCRRTGASVCWRSRRAPRRENAVQRPRVSCLRPRSSVPSREGAELRRGIAGPVAGLHDASGVGSSPRVKASPRAVAISGPAPARGVRRWRGERGACAPRAPRRSRTESTRFRWKAFEPPPAWSPSADMAGSTVVHVAVTESVGDAAGQRHGRGPDSQVPCRIRTAWWYASGIEPGTALTCTAQAAPPSDRTQ